MGKEKVGELLEEKLHSFKPGSVIKGKVVKVNKGEVIVDIGYKCEGVVSLEEFKKDKKKIEPGVEVSVVVESLEPNPNGLISLSKEKADTQLNWERIENHYQQDVPIEGYIFQRVKGGFKVDIGTIAFLPNSQTDIKPLTHPNKFVGTTSLFKIIKIDSLRKNIVVSRRKYLEEREEIKKKEYFTNLQKGMLVKGVVKNITDYGAFIEIEHDIVGLLHLNDMSWGRVSHPSQILSVGDEVEVVILDINSEKQTVSFGLKQKTANPWENIEEKYPIGSIVEGKVVNITDYGAFVKLEEGVEGLLHISELSWTSRIKHPSEVVAMGDTLQLQVIDIKKEEQKISFSLKALEPNPWPEIAKKYPVGSIVKGKVYNLTEFGAFIEIEKGIDGLLHISNISNNSIKHPSEVLRKGQKLDLIVLEVDPEARRISLGLKQLNEGYISEPEKEEKNKEEKKEKINHESKEEK